MNEKNPFEIPEIVELVGVTKVPWNRMILMHVRTLTCAEVLDESEVVITDPNKVYKYTFKNTLGIEEAIVLGVHFAYGNADFVIEEIEPILRKIAEFYEQYSYWEDENILNEHKTRMN